MDPNNNGKQLPLSLLNILNQQKQKKNEKNENEKNIIDNKIKIKKKIKRQVSIHENKFNNSVLFVGRCYGTIKDLNESEINQIKQTTSKIAFGFDPCFIPDGYNITFSKMTTSQKNKISHRGKALNELANYLKVWAEHKIMQSEHTEKNNDNPVLCTISNYAQYAVPCIFVTLVVSSVFQNC